MAKRKIDLDKLDSISTSASMKENDFVSHAIQNELNKLIEIDVDLIYENPHQPRLEIKDTDLLELANSIEQNGLIQPISLNKNSDGKYEVIAGHRRLAAYKLLNKKKIKAIVISQMDSNNTEYNSKMSSIALVENLQRKDLNVIETAIAISNLLNLGTYSSQVDLANAIGKQRIYITKCLAILKLDEVIVNDLSKNKSIKDLDALYFLQKINDPKLQVEKYFQLVNKEITRNDLIQLIKAKDTLSPIKKYNITSKNGKLVIDAKIKMLKEDIQMKMKEEIEKVLIRYLG